MCGIVGSSITLSVAAVALAAALYVGYGFVPQVIEDLVIQEVILEEDTIQWERFKEIPFPLNFTLHFFNVTNADSVLNGAPPAVSEVGPFTYRLYQQRVVESLDEEMVRYRFLNRYEFDAEYSYPNSENDYVTIANLPFHAVLQGAELESPLTMGLLNSVLSAIFGENSAPFATYRVRDIIFDGIPLCVNTGLISGIACSQIAELSASSPNLQAQPDGSLVFSLFGYKNGQLGELYEVDRGLITPREMGLIRAWSGAGALTYWHGNGSVCNMLNGTDTQIYPPFVNRDQPVYGFNTDICRSIELRYQYDTEYQGIPVARFAAHEWNLSGDDDCFCLNVTSGLQRPDGCLLPGAMEMFTCTGSTTVLTYPHFLFADPVYANGVVGVTPRLEEHRIFLDLEPNTGTVVRGAKRAQVNIFLRPISSISSTSALGVHLTPIFWLDEGIELPQEFVDEIGSKLLRPLRLVAVLVPVAVAAAAALTLVGLLLTVRACLAKPNPHTVLT